MNLENKYHVFAVINVLISKQIKLINKDDDEGRKMMAEVFAILMSSLLAHLCPDEEAEDVMVKIKMEKKKFVTDMVSWVTVSKSMKSNTARS